MELKGKTFLVTGGASGLGEGTVRMLVAAGANAVIADMNAEQGAKLAGELGTQCSVRFETGLRQTVRWYLDQEAWWRDVTSGAYKAWIDKNYGFRVAV